MQLRLRPMAPRRGHQADAACEIVYTWLPLECRPASLLILSDPTLQALPGRTTGSGALQGLPKHSPQRPSGGRGICVSSRHIRAANKPHWWPSTTSMSCISSHVSLPLLTSTESTQDPSHRIGGHNHHTRSTRNAVYKFSRQHSIKL